MVDFYRQKLDNSPSDPGGSCWWQIFRRAAWIVVLGSLALAYGWIQLERLDVAYQAQRLEEENRRLSQVVSVLKAEHSALVTPENVERLARERGFIRIDEGVTVIEGAAAGRGSRPVQWAADFRPTR